METNNRAFERDVSREKVHIHSMPFMWLFSIIGSLIFLIFSFKMFFYFVLGAASGLFGLTLMVGTVNSTKIEHLKSKMVLNYFLRYLLYGVIFAFVWLTDGIKYIWVTLAGIILIKAVLVIYALIHKGEKV